MKKYLLTLCLTMLGFVAAWAQDPDRTTWTIEASTAPIYVEVSGGNVGAGGSPNELNFKVLAPTGKTFDTDFTIQAVEAAPNSVVSSIATAGDVNSVGGDDYKVTFSPVQVGITKFYLVVKDKSSGSVLSSTAATPFEVNVFDKTKARFLVNPGAQKVDIGKSDNEILISLAPVSSEVTVELLNNVGNISINTSNPFKAKNTEDITNNIVRLLVDASTANIGDHVTVKITPAEGSLDRNGNPVQPITFTVTADLPEFPVSRIDGKPLNLSIQLNVGADFPTPLKIADTFIEGSDKDYTVLYKNVPVTGYNNVVTLTNGTSQSAILHTNHAGKAQVRATITPGDLQKSTYRAWERILDVNVVPTQLNIAIGEPTQDGATFTIPVPVLSCDPTAGIPSHTINYTLEGALPGSAHIDQTDGVKVVIDNKVPAQVFYLVATASLTGDDANDYIVNAARVPIVYGGEGADPGAYLEKQDDGSWVAYLSKPSATGTHIVANFTVKTAVAGDNSTEEELLTQFKDAKVIKVSGMINSFNIAQLVHAMGVAQQATVAVADLKTVDMSGCLMVGPLTFNDFPVQGSNTNAQGQTVPGNRGGKNLTFKNVANFTFPTPDPAYTVLPTDVSGFFGNQYDPVDNNLTSLTIPEGWTEVPDGFSGKIPANRWRSSAFSKLEHLYLGNTIEKIGPYAFYDLRTEVITMPRNLRRIGEYAFAPSPKLQDVYFTGPAPEYVDIMAFDGETQQANNTVHNENKLNKTNQDITRFEYYNNSKKVLACIMHYPKEYKSSYIDETRVYEEVPADVVYNPGNENNKYTPAGWTNEFVTDVANKKQWHSAQMNSPVSKGLRDQYYGESMIWPSQTQMSSGYCIAQAGYQWSGQPLRASVIDSKPIQYQPGAKYSDESSIDRRGLYQFIIAMSNGNSDIVFKQGLWYTICLPFNMDIDQIKEAFGDETQVCRFSKVDRNTQSEVKSIKLYFRKSVMNDMSGALDGTDYSDYSDEGHETADEEHKKEYSGIHEGIIHHFPYMIKPGGTTTGKYSWHDSENLWHFDSSMFKEVLSGTLHAESRSSEGVKYSFVPIMMDLENVGGIKPNSYIFVNYNGKHQYVFYKGVKKTDASGNALLDNDGNYIYVAGGKANQNTAYVQLSPADGQKDCNVFFGGIKANAPASSNAKAVKSFFGDDEDDEATEIENVVIICGDDPEPELDNKVYTINGVLVNGNNLPAGLYIKNGKKFIVK